ncbi:MAG: hypothetical protein HC938_06670 [Nitrospira sp.]|nr:hypothetical protein [Nitrospira sp.]
MRVKNIVTVGFLSMVVASGVANASDGVATENQRVNVIERIGAGGSAYSSNQPDNVGMCPVTGMNVTERIGHGGSTYSFSRSKSVQAGDCHTMGQAEKRPQCCGAHRGRRIDLRLQSKYEQLMA